MDCFDLQLKTTPCFLMTPDTDNEKYARRRQVVAEELVRQSFTNVRIVRGLYAPENPAFGCHFTQSLATEAALVSLSPFRPYLMLEDDAWPAQELPDVLKIPRDADAVYVGTSYFGADMSSDSDVYTSTDRGTYYSPTPHPGILRVYNMVSLHAVLVCSMRFAVNLHRCAVEACVRGAWSDVIVGLTQRYYNIYVYDPPLLFQKGDLGGNENATKRPLHGLEVTSPDAVPAPTSKLPACISRDLMVFRRGRK